MFTVLLKKLDSLFFEVNCIVFFEDEPERSQVVEAVTLHVDEVIQLVIVESAVIEGRCLRRQGLLRPDI